MNSFRRRDERFDSHTRLQLRSNGPSLHEEADVRLAPNPCPANKGGYGDGYARRDRRRWEGGVGVGRGARQGRNSPTPPTLFHRIALFLFFLPLSKRAGVKLKKGAFLSRGYGQMRRRLAFCTYAHWTNKQKCLVPCLIFHPVPSTCVSHQMQCPLLGLSGSRSRGPPTLFPPPSTGIPDWKAAQARTRLTLAHLCISPDRSVPSVVCLGPSIYPSKTLLSLTSFRAATRHCCKNRPSPHQLLEPQHLL